MVDTLVSRGIPHVRILVGFWVVERPVFDPPSAKETKVCSDALITNWADYHCQRQVVHSKREVCSWVHGKLTRGVWVHVTYS